MEAVLFKLTQLNFRESFHKWHSSGVKIGAPLSFALEFAMLWLLAHFLGVDKLGQWFFALTVGLPIFAWGIPSQQAFGKNAFSTFQTMFKIQAALYFLLVFSFLVAKLMTGLPWSTFNLWVLAVTWLAIRQWGPLWKEYWPEKISTRKIFSTSLTQHRQSIFQLWKNDGHPNVQASLEWLILTLPVYGLSWQKGWQALGYFAVIGFWLCTYRAWIHPHWLPGREALTQAVAKKDVEAFERLFLKQLGYGVLVILFLILLVNLWGGTFLLWSFGKDYARYEEILVWMIAAGGFWAMQGYFCQTRALVQSTQYPLWERAFWLALQFLLVISMVPSLGLSGAAGSLFLIAFLRSLTQMIRLEKALRYLERA